MNCRTRARTWTQGSKGPCAAITPSGTVFSISRQRQMGKESRFARPGPRAKPVLEPTLRKAKAYPRTGTNVHEQKPGIHRSSSISSYCSYSCPFVAFGSW